jgi:hypothetical protein
VAYLNCSFWCQWYILLFDFNLQVLILISIIGCSFDLNSQILFSILIITCSFDFNYQSWITYYFSWPDW